MPLACSRMDSSARRCARSRDSLAETLMSGIRNGGQLHFPRHGEACDAAAFPQFFTCSEITRVLRETPRGCGFWVQVRGDGIHPRPPSLRRSHNLKHALNSVGLLDIIQAVLNKTK